MTKSADIQPFNEDFWCVLDCLNVCIVHMLECLFEVPAVLTSCPRYIKTLLQKVLLCISFPTKEIKNRNAHALWTYFPFRKCAVVGVSHWPRTITWASASQAAIGWQLWGLCEEKLFWQDPGAQRSRWKLGEGQCRWDRESDSVGRVRERQRHRGCRDATSQHSKGQKCGGYVARRGQWFTAMTLRARVISVNSSDISQWNKELRSHSVGKYGF